MTSSRPYLVLFATLTSLIGARLPAAHAFIITPNLDPWLTTASGTRDRRGDPVTLTWSIVPNGTSVPNGSGGTLGSSTLITFLDTEFGAGSGGADLTKRPWFTLFDQAFGRWSQLSGATYIYEAHDDGVPHNSAPGALGVRGDIRIAGAVIDGPGTILAFNYFPNDGGDMVIDTADGDLFDGPENNFRYFRNTLMHEHGHGFGINHVVSDDAALLMEPSLNLSFDGPQLDEVRAIQYYFGDANEKSHNGQGNGTATFATSLGVLTPGITKRVGADADVAGQFILPTATDFVSIANLDDTDFFSFTVSQHSKLTALLTPRGGQFRQAGQFGVQMPFDADARSDLTLTIFNTNGTSQLGLANATGLGGSETLINLDLPVAGQYYARITGGPQDTIQLYELELSTIAIAAADFDEDGDVDSADLDIWQTAYGVTSLGDADSDGDTDGTDFLLWQQQYTGELGLSLAFSQSVPEPTAAALLLLAMCGATRCRLRGAVPTI